MSLFFLRTVVTDGIDGYIATDSTDNTDYSAKSGSRLLTFNLVNGISFLQSIIGIDTVMLYHRERILETSTLSCNEEEEEITKPPKR
jgi:hypothetical protein